MARLRDRQRGPTHCIVVIDDDADLLESTVALLRGEGHEVQGAAFAAEGIALVREMKPQLVLLDYYLDTGTGADVVREIRRFDEQTQVLLVTGYAAEQPARALLRDLDIQGYHDKGDGAERLLVLATAALKHWRTLERLRRQQAYLTQILEVMPDVSRLQPPHVLLRRAVDGLILILRGTEGLVATNNCGLLVLEDAEEQVSVHAGTGPYERTRGLSGLEPELAGVVRSGLSQDRPFAHPSGHVSVPLRTRSGERGCMVIECAELHEDAVEPVKIYARQVVAALENVLLYERATVDPLTQLFNRAFGGERLSEILRFGVRNGLGTSLLMLDIDHFKDLNDRYGHAAGDLALRGVAHAVQDACRDTDVAFRYGGEELAVVAPATGSADALVLAERVRRAVGALRWIYEGHTLQCTVSIGVATAPGGCSPESLLRAADRALYQAKEAGRDRCRVGSLEALPCAS